MRSRRAAGVFGLAIGAAALAGGCAHFQPTVPMRARQGDVELTLEALRTTAPRELTFRSRSSVPHTLRNAWVTEATRVPCSGGAEAVQLGVDPNRTGASLVIALPPGEHELRVAVKGLEDLDLDAVLDLELDDGACVRAPALSQSLPMEAQKRWILTAGMDVVGHQDLWGLRSTFGFEAGVSRWVGPLMLSALAGVGPSICNEGVCGRDDHNDLRSGVAIPLSLDARYGWVLGVRNGMASVGFLGARSTVTPVTLPAGDGERRFTTYGAQAVLGWGLSDQASSSFLHLERAVGMDFSIPVGVVVYPDSPGRKVAWALGLQFRFLVQL